VDVALTVIVVGFGSVGGGPPVKVADSVLTTPAISPDEKLIAFGHESSATNKPRWGIFSLADGSLQKESDLSNNADSISWSRDGKSLIYELHSAEEQTLWSRPITGGDPKLIMNLGSVEVPHVDWSSDGKTIVFVRRKLNNDLILIDLPR
jgi:Tol biopolymer transport system component